MKRNFSWSCAWLAAAFFAGAGLATVPPAAAAADAHAAVAGLPIEVQPVGDARLAEIRGGFDLGNGLLVSFGFSRTVYINGNPVANVHIDIPDVSHIDTAQANALAALVNQTTFIRNGPGNFVDPATFNQAMGGIVIQNTLDNQQIQALTTLNLTVRNLDLFGTTNLANSLQTGVINSRGP